MISIEINYWQLLTALLLLIWLITTINIVILHRTIKRKIAKQLTSGRNWQTLIELADSFEDIGIIIQRDGQYLYANKPLLKRLGMSSAEEIIGMRTVQHVTPEIRENVFKEFEKLLKYGGNYHPEVLFHKDFLGRDIYEDSRSIAIEYQGRPAILSVSLDVTVKKKTELALLASEERFRQFYEESPLPYQSLNSDGVIIAINPAWQEMLGFTAQQVLQKPFSDFLHSNSLASFLKHFTDFKKQGRITGVRYQMLNREGQVLEVEFNGRIGYDLHGNFKQTHSVLQNISQRVLMEEELKRLATTDDLTGLNNHRAFYTLAQRASIACLRYQHSLSVMMLDIDHFKLVNDRYGHQIGDQVLTTVAEIILQTIREVDVAGRIGGEEFAIILPETGLVDAAEVAERIRASVQTNQQVSAGESPIPVTISIGVAMSSTPSDDIEQLLNTADQLLYNAKANGRNRVEVQAI